MQKQNTIASPTLDAMPLPVMFRRKAAKNLNLQPNRPFQIRQKPATIWPIVPILTHPKSLAA
jgi:hypothetical protein